MMTIPERYRVPIVAVVAIVLVIGAGGAIILVGGGGPAPSSSPSASMTASPTDPGATPESAVRAFFAALAQGRRTDDPTAVLPYVTGDQSSAYLTVEGFLNGERAVGKASVETKNELSDFTVSVQGQAATVTCTQLVGGYDIDVKTGQPRESPTILPPTKFQLSLKTISGRWLVDSFEALQ